MSSSLFVENNNFVDSKINLVRSRFGSDSMNRDLDQFYIKIETVLNVKELEKR